VFNQNIDSEPLRPTDRWLDIVGANIQFRRKIAGFTQEQLAEKADLAPRTIQKIEAGSITILITTLKRIVDALECSYDELMMNRLYLEEENKRKAGRETSGGVSARLEAEIKQAKEAKQKASKKNYPPK